MLIVGRIGRPHGIRGEVTVEVRTDEPELRFAVGSVLTTDSTAVRPVAAAPPSADPSSAADGTTADGTVVDGSVPDAAVRFEVPSRLTIESVRWHQGRPLVRFAGVDDRDVAEALRGVLLCVDSAEVDDPDDPDEFRDHQLVGLTAVAPDGQTLGQVTRIDHAPASDLLVLRRPDGRSALVPFVRSIVPEVDLSGGRVVVDAPAGLFDL
ncbi:MULTISPECIES: ribosome maturation factor RimM [unclassified Solwaraspora]|uniref:ribosome maturation factor RimM n=1 Tax=unclassified Solwaraspora TaxID=2627926 RepID=UPI00259B8410|nr:ribosome maturation factor RimM [Solwaraspora sp. WMMA2056]WJK44120.1 ribosome maturation factor RimM [Solwaraspora sp. WMMA2056]